MEIGWKLMKNGVYILTFWLKKVIETQLFGFFHYNRCQPNDFKRKTSNQKLAE